MNRRGMTLVELLFAFAIFALMVMVTVYVCNMAVRMMRTSETESSLYAEGKYIMELIQEGEDTLQGIVKARATTVTVGAGATSLTFLVDRNSPYTTTTADDTTMSVTLAGTSVQIDPDTAVAGNTVAIGENVEDLSFVFNGEVVTVNLTLMRTVRGDPMRVDLSRDIWVRN